MSYQNIFVKVFLLFTLNLIVIPAIAQEQDLREEVVIHGEMIRSAFANEDIEMIKKLHHPEVFKALSYNDLKDGRGEVIEGISGTLLEYTLEFVENNIESIFIQDEVAIEQSQFAIKGTPKKGGQPFIFKGRTMVTYVRYKESPSGWATIREIIQVAN